MKILVLSITAGQGHNSTAKALCEYFDAIGCETKVLDTFEYINPMLGKTVDKGYLFTSKNTTHAYRKIYRLEEKRHKSKTDASPTRAAYQLMSKKLLKYIDAYAPDAILCTHVFPCIMLDLLRERKKLSKDIPTVGILTDYTMHPFWEESTRMDYVVIPNEQLILQAVKKGFRQKQILPFGIPIRSGFSEKKNKAEMRLRYGLDPDTQTVLLMSGSMGYGNIEKTVRTLDGLALDLQVIVVCGNNKEAKAKVDAMKTHKKIVTFGFVNFVDELMDAADCIISKPGGLSTSESLAKKLPMITVNPIPGHEDRNTSFLTNNGAAMAVTETIPLDDVLYQFFANTGHRRLMEEAIGLIAKPYATRDICEFVKNLCLEKKTK